MKVCGLWLSTEKAYRVVNASQILLKVLEMGDEFIGVNTANLHLNFNCNCKV